jgi:hypothetical protein
LFLGTGRSSLIGLQWRRSVHTSPQMATTILKHKTLVMKKVFLYIITIIISLILITFLSIFLEAIIYQFRLAGVELWNYKRYSFIVIYWINGMVLLLSVPIYLYVNRRYHLNFKQKLLLISVSIFLIILVFAYGTFAGGFDFRSIYTYYRLFISFILGLFFVLLEYYLVLKHGRK